MGKLREEDGVKERQKVLKMEEGRVIVSLCRSSLIVVGKQVTRVIQSPNI